MSKPKILVSACLGFSSCRYDGKLIPNAFVKALGNYVDFITVCPEVGIELGIPRPPIVLVRQPDLVLVKQPETGLDLTTVLEEYANNFMDNLPEIQGAILKSRSPSCGIADVKIFRSIGAVTPFEYGSGIFAAEVLKRYPAAAVSTDEGLLNTAFRKKWLKLVFNNRVPAALMNLFPTKLA